MRLLLERVPAGVKLELRRDAPPDSQTIVLSPALIEQIMPLLHLLPQVARADKFRFSIDLKE